MLDWASYVVYLLPTHHILILLDWNKLPMSSIITNVACVLACPTYTLWTALVKTKKMCLFSMCLLVKSL